MEEQYSSYVALVNPVTRQVIRHFYDLPNLELSTADQTIPNPDFNPDLHGKPDGGDDDPPETIVHNDQVISTPQYAFEYSRRNNLVLLTTTIRDRGSVMLLHKMNSKGTYEKRGGVEEEKEGKKLDWAIVQP